MQGCYITAYDAICLISIHAELLYTQQILLNLGCHIVSQFDPSSVDAYSVICEWYFHARIGCIISDMCVLTTIT
uniref:Uncharacterized protein n=1 Tax=Arundo donax TaxID=35708 RepID=A0A0A9A5V6_ARUDO